MNFKTQIQRDIKSVFHNDSEFADKVEFWYDQKRYNVPVIFNSAGTNSRKKPSTDYADGIFLADLVMYVAFTDIKTIPRKGMTLEIGDEVYTIVSSANEDGEIIISLEMLGE